MQGTNTVVLFFPGPRKFQPSAIRSVPTHHSEKLSKAYAAEEHPRQYQEGMNENQAVRRLHTI